MAPWAFRDALSAGVRDGGLLSPALFSVRSLLPTPPTSLPIGVTQTGIWGMDSSVQMCHRFWVTAQVRVLPVAGLKYLRYMCRMVAAVAVDAARTVTWMSVHCGWAQQ